MTTKKQLITLLNIDEILNGSSLIEFLSISNNYNKYRFEASFIKHNYKIMKIDKLSNNQLISEDLFPLLIDYVNIKSIGIHQQLSEKFIETYFNLLSIDIISAQKLSKYFINKYKDKLSLKILLLHNEISEKLILDNQILFKKYALYIIMYHNPSYNLITNFCNGLLKEFNAPRYIAVFNCGFGNRMIKRKYDSDLISIGCFKGTYQEAIHAIDKKYKNTSIGINYKTNVLKCFEKELLVNLNDI